MKLTKREPKGINNPFLLYCGMETYIDEEDDVVVVGEVRPEFRNPYGYVHGGFLASIADNAAGFCASRYIEAPVTLNSTLNYLSTTNAGKIYASGKLVRAGHKIVVVRCSIYSDDRTLLAEGDFTYYNAKHLEFTKY